MYTDNSEAFNEILKDIELKLKQLRLMSDGLNGLDKHILKKTMTRKVEGIGKNISYSLRVVNKDS